MAPAIGDREVADDSAVIGFSRSGIGESDDGDDEGMFRGLPCTRERIGEDDLLVLDDFQPDMADQRRFAIRTVHVGMVEAAGAEIHFGNRYEPWLWREPLLEQIPSFPAAEQLVARGIEDAMQNQFAIGRK